MTDNDILFELLEQALPFLEKRMSESPQPELVKLVERIRSYSLYKYGDFT
jgi:hypothetical protein